ncbi:MAG: aldo/keto reductase [Rhodothermales bacterium]|nr:aldo/keto reductase [Rhodothermales bacterium]
MIFHTIQGERVPALGLGTWRLDGDACREAVEHALDLGYRHIDTAQAYENEEPVGRGLAASPVGRGDVFLTTKIWLDNLGPEAVRASTEASLRRLGTDYVDLLLIHWPSDEVPLEETLDALVVLRDEGKTRHIGVSNFTPSLLRRALDHARLFCCQVEYHPFLAQDDLLALCRRHDLLLTAYSPLARGKVQEEDVLREIAEAHGKTPFQVTLRWHLQQDSVAAIPKASSAEHREANFDLFDFALSDAEMERIAGLAEGRRLIDPDFAPAWEDG